MVLSILLFGLFVQGLLAIFVYRDAYQRGAEQGLWAASTLLFGIVGVLVYLIQRPDEKLSEEQLAELDAPSGMKIIALYGGSFFVGIVTTLIGTSWYIENTAATTGNDVFLPLLIAPTVLLFLYRQSSVEIPTSM